MTGSSDVFAPGSIGRNGHRTAPQPSRLPRTKLPPERKTAFEPTPAGFVSRSIAIAIDLGLVLAMIVGTSSLTQLVALVLPKWLWLTAALPAAVAVAVSLIPLAYFFLTVAVTGRTVGKALMGLRIVHVNGGKLSVARSLVRVPAYLVSLFPLFMGFLWVLVDRDRRGWHDMIAGSRVVYEPRSP